MIGTSSFRGGSNAEAGCNLIADALDLVLELLTFRAGRAGRATVIDADWAIFETVGRELGGTLGDGPDGRPRSDTSDPPRRILGSGWMARWDRRGVRVSCVPSVEEDGVRTDCFEASREGRFGDAGNARALPGAREGKVEEADLAEAADMRRERAVDSDD